jgi:hypothetical protein
MAVAWQLPGNLDNLGPFLDPQQLIGVCHHYQSNMLVLTLIASVHQMICFTAESQVPGGS